MPAWMLNSSKQVYSSESQLKNNLTELVDTLEKEWERAEARQRSCLVPVRSQNFTSQRNSQKLFEKHVSENYDFATHVALVGPLVWTVARRSLPMLHHEEKLLRRVSSEESCFGRAYGVGFLEFIVVLRSEKGYEIRYRVRPSQMSKWWWLKIFE